MKKTYITAMLMSQSLVLCAQQVHVGGVCAKLPKTSTITVNVPVESAAPQTKVPVRRVLASTERGVGYCSGDSITTKGACFGTAGTYSVAADLSSSVLSSYKGCKVVGIRFALSQSIGKSKVFIYKVSGQNASALVNANVRRTSEGWNEVRFNSAQEYTIQDNDELIIGYDYNESEAMATAEEGAMCFYTPKTSTPKASLFMKDDGFYYMEGVGNLCVQLIVDVSSLPKKDVQLTHLLAGGKYQKTGATLDTYVQLQNVGLEDISSMRLGYRFDDGEATYKDYDEEVKADGLSGVSLLLPLPKDITPGAHKLTVFVDNIEGSTPTKPDGDEIANSFVVYTKSLERQQTYVEQYCSQDESMAYYINPGMDEAAQNKDVCLVNVYKHGEPLAPEGSSYLENLYAYTYPCFTVDRFYFFGENNIAFDLIDYATFMPQLVSEAVEQLVNENRAGNPSFATVNLSSAYTSATRQLTLDVTGDVTDEAKSIYGDIGLTLMLVENGVVSPQKVVGTLGYGTTTDNKYVHNHVLRAYVTSPKGDRMDIADGKYSAHYTYTLPADWNADNMQVVALAGKYMPTIDDSNVLDADITNACTVKLTGGTSGISAVNTANVASPADGIYTLDGTRVSNPSKGLYIVRKGGVARKVVIKNN